jgi:hypothetical protein
VAGALLRSLLAACGTQAELCATLSILGVIDSNHTTLKIEMRREERRRYERFSNPKINKIDTS